MTEAHFCIWISRVHSRSLQTMKIDSNNKDSKLFVDLVKIMCSLICEAKFISEAVRTAIEVVLETLSTPRVAQANPDLSPVSRGHGGLVPC